MTVHCGDHQDRFSAWFDGELDAPEAWELDAHLRGCADCTAAWRRFQTSAEWLRSGLRQTAAAAPDPRYAVELARRLEHSRRPAARWRLLAPMAAAALLLAACGLFIWLQGRKQPPGAPAWTIAGNLETWRPETGRWENASALSSGAAVRAGDTPVRLQSEAGLVTLHEHASAVWQYQPDGRRSTWVLADGAMEIRNADHDLVIDVADTGIRFQADSAGTFVIRTHLAGEPGNRATPPAASPADELLTTVTNGDLRMRWNGRQFMLRAGDVLRLDPQPLHPAVKQRIDREIAELPAEYENFCATLVRNRQRQTLDTGIVSVQTATLAIPDATLSGDAAQCYRAASLAGVYPRLRQITARYAGVPQAQAELDRLVAIDAPVQDPAILDVWRDRLTQADAAAPDSPYRDRYAIALALAGDSEGVTWLKRRVGRENPESAVLANGGYVLAALGEPAGKTALRTLPARIQSRWQTMLAAPATTTAVSEHIHSMWNEKTGEITMYFSFDDPLQPLRDDVHSLAKAAAGLRRDHDDSGLRSLAKSLPVLYDAALRSQTAGETATFQLERIQPAPTGTATQDPIAARETSETPPPVEITHAGEERRPGEEDWDEAELNSPEFAARVLVLEALDCLKRAASRPEPRDPRAWENPPSMADIRRQAYEFRALDRDAFLDRVTADAAQCLSGGQR